MRKNIIITGQPKSGKSVLLRKLIAEIPNKTGFVTNQILENGTRIGFEMETCLGDKSILAHIGQNTSHKVGKYFVNVSNLETLLEKVPEPKTDDVLYIDEIGEMQLFSEKFRDFVLRRLDSKNTCIATLSAVYENEFTKQIREREDIILVQLTPENREIQEKFVSTLLRKIEKAP